MIRINPSTDFHRVYLLRLKTSVNRRFILFFKEVLIDNLFLLPDIEEAF